MYPRGVRGALNIDENTRRALNAGVEPDFPGQLTGSFQTFDVVSNSMASGGSDTQSISFPVTSALYAVQAAALLTNQDAAATSRLLGNLDQFLIQITYSDRTQLNAGAPVLASALFSHLDGIYWLKKPTVVGPNQSLTCFFQNVSDPAKTAEVHLTFRVLQLELSTSAAQF